MKHQLLNSYTWPLCHPLFPYSPAPAPARFTRAGCLLCHLRYLGKVYWSETKEGWGALPTHSQRAQLRPCVGSPAAGAAGPTCPRHAGRAGTQSCRAISPAPGLRSPAQPLSPSGPQSALASPTPLPPPGPRGCWSACGCC